MSNNNKILHLFQQTRTGPYIGGILGEGCIYELYYAVG